MKKINNRPKKEIDYKLRKEISHEVCCEGLWTSLMSRGFCLLVYGTKLEKPAEKALKAMLELKEEIEKLDVQTIVRNVTRGRIDMAKKKSVEKTAIGLTKVVVYMWGCYGEENVNNALFRLEYDTFGSRNYLEAKAPQIRKKLSELSTKYKVSLPQISFAEILGNEDDGGKLYKWEKARED